MRANCTGCLHLKKAGGEMFVFCKMNKLPKVQILSGEVCEEGLIKLVHREVFDFAKACPMFVNMDDEEESTEGGYEDRQAIPVVG